MRSALGNAANTVATAVKPTIFQVCDAAKKGDLVLLTSLLDSGGNVNETRTGVLEVYGYTALHEACYNRHHNVVSLLLSRGADPNARTLGGLVSGKKTPLMIACEVDASLCIDALFSSALLDANALCQSGWPALHYAVNSGSSMSVNSLLSFPSTNPNFILSNSLSALDIAFEKSEMNSSISLLIITALVQRTREPLIHASLRRLVQNQYVIALQLAIQVGVLSDQAIVMELLTIALDGIDASHKESEAIVERKQNYTSTASSSSSSDKNSHFSDFQRSLSNQKKGITIMRELLGVFKSNSHVQIVREAAQTQEGGVSGGAASVSGATFGSGGDEGRSNGGSGNDQDFNKTRFAASSSSSSSSSSIPTSITSSPPLPPPLTELPQHTSTTTTSSSTKNASNDSTDDPV